MKISIFKITLIFILGIALGLGISIVFINSDKTNNNLTKLYNNTDFKAYLAYNDQYPVFEIKKGIPCFNRVKLINSSLGLSKYQLQLDLINGSPIAINEHDDDYLEQIVQILSIGYFSNFKNDSMSNTFTIGIVVDYKRDKYVARYVSWNSKLNTEIKSLFRILGYYFNNLDKDVSTQIAVPFPKESINELLPMAMENDIIYIDKNNYCIVWRNVDYKLTNIFTKKLSNNELTSLLRNLRDIGNQE